MIWSNIVIHPLYRLLSAKILIPLLSAMKRKHLPWFTDHFNSQKMRKSGDSSSRRRSSCCPKKLTFSNQQTISWFLPEFDLLNERTFCHVTTTRRIYCIIKTNYLAWSKNVTWNQMNFLSRDHDAQNLLRHKNKFPRLIQKCYLELDELFVTWQWHAELTASCKQTSSSLQ